MYATPDWVQVVRDVGIVLAVLTAFVASSIGLGKFLIVKPLQAYIDERVPKNGGKSLRELHEKFDTMDARIGRIEKELTRIDEELDHVDD
jgi:hypothetical protein